MKKDNSHTNETMYKRVKNVQTAVRAQPALYKNRHPISLFITPTAKLDYHVRPTSLLLLIHNFLTTRGPSSG